MLTIKKVTFITATSLTTFMLISIWGLWIPIISFFIGSLLFICFLVEVLILFIDRDKKARFYCAYFIILFIVSFLRIFAPHGTPWDHGKLHRHIFWDMGHIH